MNFYVNVKKLFCRYSTKHQENQRVYWIDAGGYPPSIITQKVLKIFMVYHTISLDIEYFKFKHEEIIRENVYVDP